MKIITLTLNVALDVHCHTPSLRLSYENIANVISRDAGGKGINISRALCAAHVPNTAVAVLGREGRADFENSLKADGINALVVETDGRIRENITVHTDSDGETRISFSGTPVTEALLDEVYKTLSTVIDGDSVLTFTGSVPDGIGKQALMRFLHTVKQSGAKLAIDSRSLTGDEVVSLSPYLVKPNEDEISLYFGCAVNDTRSAARAAESLCKAGIENVMISLGGRGAVLACGEGTYAASAPHISVRSTIGAGDSSIAGFLAAVREGKSAAEALRTAVAFGSAACLTDGTKPPIYDDILHLYENIRVERI